MAADHGGPTGDVPVVEVRGLTKEFPGVTALNGVDLVVRRGEVHALVGQNGAGKSTLIKILTGVYQKDSGAVLLNGREVQVGSPEQALRLGIATVYQELVLARDLPVAENVYLGRYPRTRSGLVDYRAMREGARRLLAPLGADIDPRVPVRRLGTGAQQLVVIARALLWRARLLVMDEPTAPLTQREIEGLFRVIRSLKRDGVAVLYVSHRLEEIFAIADVVTVLRDGVHVATEPIASTNVDRVIAQMVGHAMVRAEWTKATPGEEVLRIERLSTAAKLHDVSFSLRRGEVLGLAGMVGSGRTELARALFGVDRVSQGSIWLSGQKVVIQGPQDAIARGLALLPEDRRSQGLVLPMTVAHNITIAILDRLRRFGVIRRREETGVAAGMIERLAIRPPKPGRQVASLSGGNQQKVVLAKWLARSSRVFVFDEPTRGIDVAAKAEIYRLIGELCRSGSAVIVISSDVDELLAICNRVLVMRDGCVVADLDVNETSKETVLNLAIGVTQAHAAV